MERRQMVRSPRSLATGFFAPATRCANTKARRKRVPTKVGRRRTTRGVALLVALFVIAVTSALVVAILDTQTTQWAAARNTADYERALYLAGAAVQHVLVQLESNYAWRGTITDGSYPADDTYSGTAADGAGGDVTVTGIGVAGGATRTLQVTVTPGT